MHWWCLRTQFLLLDQGWKRETRESPLLDEGVLTYISNVLVDDDRQLDRFMGRLWRKLLDKCYCRRSCMRFRTDDRRLSGEAGVCSKHYKGLPWAEEIK
jgi:hypothetical protein